MKNNIILLLILLLLNIATSYAYGDSETVRPENFTYSIKLTDNFTPNMISRIHLNANILSKCSYNCKDMRIFDDNSNEIPYVIIKHKITQTPNPILPMNITVYESDNVSVSITMQFKKERLINEITLKTTNTNFNKMLTLYGSTDLANWIEITKDKIYDFSAHVELRKTAIALNEPVAFQFYKIELTEQEDQNINESLRLKYGDLDFSLNKRNAYQTIPFKINAITATLKENKAPSSIYDSMVLIPTKKQVNHTTELSFEVSPPVDNIIFDIDYPPYYNRVVSVYYKYKGLPNFFFLGNDNIYNFPIADVWNKKTSMTSDELQLFYQSNTSPTIRQYKLVIWDNNNLPVNVNAIKIEWLRRYIYFIPNKKTKEYTLCFGNGEVSFPKYDLENFINQDNWFRHTYKEPAITKIIFNKDFKQIERPKDSKAKIEKTILTIVVILLVCLMGFWLYKLVNVKNSNVER
ncbi:MAG: hypothetical protein L3V56_01400 [Candidatus Magnetoovum sp. WYHC-5]|nr:hypothetical protein [Candidatus Magnetoovum sp. WYHC-5]